MFGVNDAYVPFAVFRRPSYVGGWAVKNLKLRSPRSAQQLDIVLREVLGCLSENRVVPYHIYHVEHCVGRSMYNIISYFRLFFFFVSFCFFLFLVVSYSLLTIIVVLE